MGEVYRARDTTLDRDVAIKVLPEAFAADAERLARFEREAKVLASLNHPNIAQIHGLEPSRCSIAKKSMPSWWPTSKTGQLWGWLRAATASASRSKRSRRSEVATVRSRRGTPRGKPLGAPIAIAAIALSRVDPDPRNSRHLMIALRADAPLEFKQRRGAAEDGTASPAPGRLGINSSRAGASPPRREGHQLARKAAVQATPE